MSKLKEEISKNNLPREKFIKEGVKNLSNLDLMMIILGSGIKNNNVLTVSKDVLNIFEEIKNPYDITYHELIQIRGIGKIKAIQLISCIELMFRLTNIKSEKLKFNQPKEIFKYYKNEFNRYEEEHLFVIYFDAKLNLVLKKEISFGGINQTLISVNTILKWALKTNSLAILLMHNHPSGDPTPSNDDINKTMDIKNAANLLGIDLIDHIIFARNSYFSFLEKGVLK